MRQKLKLIGIIVILITLPLTVIVAQQVQNIVNRAAEPERQLILGMSNPGGYSSQDQHTQNMKNHIEQVYSQTGRYPATYPIWVNFGIYGDDSPRNSFPNWDILGYLDARNITPVIFLQPVGPPIERRDGRFAFSANTAVGPLNGQVRFNSTNPGAINKIYVSKNQVNAGQGFNTQELVNTWVAGAQIGVYGQNANGQVAYNNANKFVFNVTGKVDSGSYWTINVNVAQAGTLNGLFDQGNIIYLTMAPDEEARKFTNARIAAGSQNEFLTQFAQAARNYNKRIILRYAHEMNGDIGNNDVWFPWSPGQPNTKVPGDYGFGRFRYFDYPEANSPENYAAAWRYIYNLIHPIAPNVKFYWCANNTNLSQIGTLARYYPGNGYVDYVGFDVYEWNNSYTSMVELFRPNVRSVRQLVTGNPDAESPKPIIVGETGIVPSNGERSRWIAEGYPQVFNAFPDMEAIFYFNFGGWTMDAGMLTAYRDLGNRFKFQGDFTPKRPTGTITATPNQCAIPLNGTTCTTTISWNASNTNDAGVKLSNGQTFAAGLNGNQAAPWISEGNIDFILYSENNQELARVTVSGVKQAAPTETQTATPTNRPATPPMSVPTSSVSTPTSFTPTPTPTPGGQVITTTAQSEPLLIADGTSLSFVVGLDSIGTTGTNRVNTFNNSNKNPKHPQRSFTVEIFDSQNQKISDVKGSLNYVSDTKSVSFGKFTATVTLGKDFPGANYTVKIKTDGFLRKGVPGIQSLKTNKVNTIPQINLIGGDINSDNRIDILDYNLLVSCSIFAKTEKARIACNSNSFYKIQAYINDDGNVNELDYGYFLQEYSVQNGD